MWWRGLSIEVRPVRRITPDGASEPATRTLAAETPVAIEFNGIGYAVMMMTPADLDDFATGFAHAERLLDAGQVLDGVDTHATEKGLILRANLPPECAARVAERVRHRVAESSCGLCGLENLEQALRPLPRVTATSSATPQAIFAALSALPAHQPLSQKTGAVHAAALCASDGSIRLVREDVGRHNAFDKLAGAMARAGLDWEDGFAIITARASYELVEKAALSNCPLLVAISAPTSLAAARAQEAGLRLIVLARSDSMLEME
jgi:FdhD protein